MSSGRMEPQGRRQAMLSLANADLRTPENYQLIQEVLDFRYDDGWYSGTDGDGLSLEITDVAHADPDRFSEKQTWRPSLDLGGSPGR